MLVISTACAGATHGATGNAGKITPPVQMRPGSPPEIREAVDLRIEVLIAADGQPDLTTLKVTGKGSGNNHAAIEDWIRNSTFKPAMQDGHPVPAVFKMSLKSTIQRM